MSLTFDHWTNDQNQSFLTVTSHFLDKEFNMCSFTLDTIHIID